MFTAPCPSCGAPVRLSVATPDHVRCRACGRQGPPPPEVADALRRAARILGERSERERQLDERSKAQLARSARSPLFVASVGALLSAPALGLLALLLHFVLAGSAEPMLAALCAGPALATPVVVAAALFALMARRASLAEAAAATPPEAPGEPAACRVCGAQLGGSGAVVRCDYCKADNVVRAEVLERASARAQHAELGIEAEVARRASAVRATAGGAVLLALATAVLGPIVGLAFALVVASALDTTEVATQGTESVAIVEDEHGRCVAERRGTEAAPLLWRGGREDQGFAAAIPLASAGEIAWRATGSLVGEHVSVPPGGDTGVVEAVHRTALTDHDLARVRMDAGGVRDVPFGGLCLAPPSATP